MSSETSNPCPNQPPTNPISSQGGGGGQTQNKGGAQGGDREQTQNKGGAQGGDRGQTQNKGGTQGGDRGQTQNKGGAQGGDGGKTQNKWVAECGDMGDKPKTNKVPKVGAGEAPMIPMQESLQRNVKFEQDRKRCSMDTDGKNPHWKSKSTQRCLCFWSSLAYL